MLRLVEEYGDLDKIKKKIKQSGKYCGFKNLICHGDITDCTLQSVDNGLCVFWLINANLYEIRKTGEETRDTMSLLLASSVRIEDLLAEVLMRK